MKNPNYIIYILLITITALLLYIIFKGEIDQYFFRKEVLKKAALINIPSVFNRCIDYSAEPDEDGIYSDWNMETCKPALEEYKPAGEKFKSLIKNKKNISCADFSSRDEASEFFYFVSGEVFQSVLGNGIKGLELDRCVIDPYGLDTDHDCRACEHYETEIDRQIEAETTRRFLEEAGKKYLRR